MKIKGLKIEQQILFKNLKNKGVFFFLGGGVALGGAETKRFPKKKA
jgi:hypothetical protein